MGKMSKNQILEMCYHEFLDSGYDKTTLRLLSSKLNITHGNILYHFKSKDFIALDLLRKYFDLWFISCDIFFDPVTRKEFDKNYLFQTVIHFTYMNEHPDFAKFYTEFLKTGSNLFVEQFKTYFTRYVDTFNNTNYEQGFINEEMDVRLIVEANTTLVSFILDGQATVRDACEYMYNLLNLFWNLGKTSLEIEKDVDNALLENPRIMNAVRFMDTEMQKY